MFTQCSRRNSVKSKPWHNVIYIKQLQFWSNSWNFQEVPTVILKAADNFISVRLVLVRAVPSILGHQLLPWQHVIQIFDVILRASQAAGKEKRQPTKDGHVLNWNDRKNWNDILKRRSVIPLYNSTIRVRSAKADSRFRASEEAKALYLAPLKATRVTWPQAIPYLISWSARHYVKRRCVVGRKHLVNLEKSRT